MFDVGGKGQFLDAGGSLLCLPSLLRNLVTEAKFLRASLALALTLTEQGRMTMGLA